MRSLNACCAGLPTGGAAAGIRRGVCSFTVRSRVGTTAEPVRRELIERRVAGENAIRERFARALAEGDLPAGTSPADLAGYVVTVMRGMAVQAAGGASRDELRRVAELALRAWPA